MAQDPELRQVSLDPRPEAQRQARAFVRRALEDRVPSEVVDDAELVTAELVANAIKHARTAIDLRVADPAGEIRIEVTDEAVDVTPRYVPFDANSESGRGLHLVNALSTVWGCDVDLNAKTVWCRMRLPRPAPGAGSAAEAAGTNLN